LKTSQEFWSIFDGKSPIVVYGYPGTGKSTFLMNLAVHAVAIDPHEKRSALINCSSHLTVNRLQQIAGDADVLQRIIIFRPTSIWNLLEMIDDFDLFSRPYPQILIDNPFWKTGIQDYKYLSYIFSKLQEFFDNASVPSPMAIAVQARKTSNGIAPTQHLTLERYFKNQVWLEKTKNSFRAILNFDNHEKLQIKLRMSKRGLSLIPST